MTHKLEGQLVLDGQKIAIVISRFNDFFTSRLLAGSIDTIVRHGGSASNVTEVWVPGAYEIPLAASKLAASKKHSFDGIICLGCLVRGSTPHFDYISAEVTKGIATVGLNTGIPISYGVITVDSLEQAIERSGTKAGNKGNEAALSLIEMLNLYKQLD